VLDAILLSLLTLFSWGIYAPVAFQFSMGCCCGCDCSFSDPSPCVCCDNCTMSEDYEIVLAGITNGTCSSCGDLNATYIVTSVGTCSHELSDALACGFDRLDLSSSCLGSGDADILGASMDKVSDPITYGMGWKTADGFFTANGHDCKFESELLSYWALASTGTKCNASAATASVTHQC